MIALFALLAGGVSACGPAHRIRTTDQCYSLFKTPGLRGQCAAVVRATGRAGIPKDPARQADGEKPKPGPPNPPGDGRGEVQPGCTDPVPCRLALAERAQALRQKPRWRAGGQTFRPDCVGFVSTALILSGFDLVGHRPKAIAGQVGGGVRLLWHMAQRYHMLHTRKRPEVGDIIFWDDTTDRNGNGKLDDPLTHVGLVYRVDEDGTITYIHKGNSGIRECKMNLDRPSVRRDPETGQVLNSYLRRPGYAGDRKRLAGELFRAFATVYGAPLNSS